MTKRLTDEQVKTIILRAREGDEIAQFHHDSIKRICEEQFKRVEKQLLNNFTHSALGHLLHLLKVV